MKNLSSFALAMSIGVLMTVDTWRNSGLVDTGWIIAFAIFAVAEALKGAVIIVVPKPKEPTK
jgi:steroid 5-alpha reductase family enzyme